MSNAITYTTSVRKGGEGQDYLGQHLMFNSDSLDSEGFLSTMILMLPEELAGFELASASMEAE